MIPYDITVYQHSFSVKLSAYDIHILKIVGSLSPSFYILKINEFLLGEIGTVYEGGLYHGLVRLDHEYPAKAPSICLLTPNGRWEVGKAICLSGL